jgi:hypothetical protein
MWDNDETVTVETYKGERIRMETDDIPGRVIKNQNDVWCIGQSKYRKMNTEIQIDNDVVFIRIQSIIRGCIMDTLMLTLTEFFLLPFNDIAKTREITDWIISNGTRQVKISFFQFQISIRVIRKDEDGEWRKQRSIELRVEEFMTLQSYSKDILGYVSKSDAGGIQYPCPVKMVTSANSDFTCVQ